MNPDPLAEALARVLDGRRRSGPRRPDASTARCNWNSRDELHFARQVREVAQITWMHAGAPGRLRDEDFDRASVVYELVEQCR